MATLIIVQDIVWSPDKARGGHSMCILQWLKGLERLGHRIVFLDFINYSGGKTAYPPEAITRFERMIERWWHRENTALIDAHTDQPMYGLTADEIRRAVKEAAGLITIGWDQPTAFTQNMRPRLLIEYDPGYTHLWAQIKSPAEVYGVHDFYFTVGANIGTPRCAVATGGIDWRPLWNPIVLEWWQSEQAITRDRFTTVADWWGMGYLEYEGRLLGPKAEQFKRFIDLPRLVGESPGIALEIDPGSPDLELLKSRGWIIEDPKVVYDPDSYQTYISGSAGEFTCVKGGYSGTRCGWFSDRSACYLAAGRPVVMQSTGFEDVLPTGEGLFAVRNVEEAAEAIHKIRRDYPRHSAAARRIAEEHFDSDKVVAKLLREAGL